MRLWHSGSVGRVKFKGKMVHKALTYRRGKGQERGGRQLTHRTLSSAEKTFTERSGFGSVSKNMATAVKQLSKVSLACFQTSVGSHQGARLKQKY